MGFWKYSNLPPGVCGKPDIAKVAPSTVFVKLKPGDVSGT